MTLHIQGYSEITQIKITSNRLHFIIYLFISISIIQKFLYMFTYHNKCNKPYVTGNKKKLFIFKKPKPTMNDGN